VILFLFPSSLPSLLILYISVKFSLSSCSPFSLLSSPLLSFFHFLCPHLNHFTSPYFLIFCFASCFSSPFSLSFSFCMSCFHS
jgi:hypothetical protein